MTHEQADGWSLTFLVVGYIISGMMVYTRLYNQHCFPDPAVVRLSQMLTLYMTKVSGAPPAELAPVHFAAHIQIPTILSLVLFVMHFMVFQLLVGQAWGRKLLYEYDSFDVLVEHKSHIGVWLDIRHCLPGDWCGKVTLRCKSKPSSLIKSSAAAHHKRPQFEWNYI